MQQNIFMHVKRPPTATRVPNGLHRCRCRDRNRIQANSFSDWRQRTRQRTRQRI